MLPPELSAEQPHAERGPRIELVGRGMEPFIACWWATATTATE
jgi:hypothetical protein